MGLSRTVYEIDRDFSRKSQNFPTLVFCALAEEVPLGIGYWGWGSDIRQKTRMMGLPGRQMMFDDIFSRLDTMHQRDRRTDRRISQQRPHLRITSRGKNYVIILSVFFGMDLCSSRNRRTINILRRIRRWRWWWWWIFMRLSVPGGNVADVDVQNQTKPANCMTIVSPSQSNLWCVIWTNPCLFYRTQECNQLTLLCGAQSDVAGCWECWCWCWICKQSTSQRAQR